MRLQPSPTILRVSARRNRRNLSDHPRLAPRTAMSAAPILLDYDRERGLDSIGSNDPAEWPMIRGGCSDETRLAGPRGSGESSSATVKSLPGSLSFFFSLLPRGGSPVLVEKIIFQNFALGYSSYLYTFVFFLNISVLIFSIF